MVILLLGTIREKIKMSEDDIKTIFFVLDAEQRGKVSVQDLGVLKEGVEGKLREFYRSRINRDMVKVTILLGRIHFLNWVK